MGMKAQILFHMPVVIGIGPVRSGTTWLDAIFRVHPEIQMPYKVKELNFFSLKISKGISWYISQFIPINPEAKMWGEISPSYISCKECPQRIKSILPHAKIIISLRNLYDMTLSMYGLYLRYGGNHIGLYRAIRSKELEKISFGLDICNLHHYIKRYCDIFTRDNIFFMIYDDLVSSPHKLAKKIYEFVSMDSSHTNAIVGQHFNRMIMPSNRMLAKLAAVIQGNLRKHELHYIANKLKQNTIIRKLLFNSKQTKLEISSEDKSKAFQYLSNGFDKEIDILSKITGISLQHWKFKK